MLFCPEGGFSHEEIYNSAGDHSLREALTFWTDQGQLFSGSRHCGGNPRDKQEGEGDTLIP